jgi:hypothetical protein
MYFLPQDIIVKCPTLCGLPRKIRKVLYDELMMEVVDSDQFLNEIMQAASALVFPHLGFGGWREHYTGYSPVWIIANITSLWAKMLEAEIGWDVQALLDIPSYANIPFFDSEYIKEVMGRIVKRGIAEYGLLPILDVMREMPCDEDFEPWNTNVRKDFIRKWYHTRSKKVQTVSLEECMEDDEHGIHEVEDISSDFQDRVVADDFCQKFKARLPDKDMEILELRDEGFTYEEIADKLGYKNHSGVIKRMQAIKNMFLKYEGEQQ